jgi:TatD DNase family protein
MTKTRDNLVDIGANLTHDSFEKDRQQVLDRAVENGVLQMVVTGASIQGSEDAVALSATNDKLFATVGIHPHHAEETNDSVIAHFTELAKDTNVKAIGETGLDFFRDFSPRKTQISSFERHIELSANTGLPMFLHERDAYPTFAEVLKPDRDRLKNVVVHCFTGEKDALYAYLDLDCYIGITGWICDERRGAHLVELVKGITPNRLMIETDAPYLLPRNIRPKPKSRRNEPHNLTVICQFVADALNLSFEDLARQTRMNSQSFFDLPEMADSTECEEWSN